MKLLINQFFRSLHLVFDLLRAFDERSQLDLRTLGIAISAKGVIGIFAALAAIYFIASPGMGLMSSLFLAP